MRRLISALILFTVHAIGRVFYRVEVKWLNPWPDDPWHHLKRSNLRLILFLNHTSLYEPLFAGGIPLHFLWFLAGRLLTPGADITLQRPIVGTFFKLLMPSMVSISRKRDKTWEGFLQLISDHKIVMLAPEGRMKRRNGLDSKGQPMSVRGGVADILNVMDEGTLVMCYSGGLHHVQAPGERFPRLFQTLKIQYEAIPISQYKSQIKAQGDSFKLEVVKDLERRIQTYCN